MKSVEVADRYAQAIYELGVEEGILEKLQSDLDEVSQIINSNDYLLPFLVHPLVPEKDKRKILEDVFGDSLLRETLNFLKLLVNKGREDYLPLIYKRLGKIRRDEEEIIEVKITVPPRPGEDGIEEMVKDRLGEITGKAVHVTEIEVDEDLISGIRLQVGDQVIDGSVRSRLEELREFLLEGGSK